MFKKIKVIKTTKVADTFHYAGGTYKPWWVSGDAEKVRDSLEIDGWNSGYPSSVIDELLEEMAEAGEIIKNKPYLIECNIKITQLEQEEED